MVGCGCGCNGRPGGCGGGRKTPAFNSGFPMALPVRSDGLVMSTPEPVAPPMLQPQPAVGGVGVVAAPSGDALGCPIWVWVAGLAIAWALRGSK